MPAARSDPLAVAALMFGAAAIGFSPILARLTETGPAAGAFWRVFLATPLLFWPAMRAQAGAKGPQPWALLAGVFFAGDMACWHYGLVYTSVANATVLPNLAPVVVTGAAWLLFGERPRRLFLFALVLAVGGAMLMAAAKGAGGRGTNPPLGDALSAITALWYGAYFLAMRRARDVQGAMRAMFWAGLSGSPVLLAVALALGEEVFPASSEGWAAAWGLGLIHAVGQGSIAWGLGRLPAALASVTVLVQPLVAALLGFLIFSEALVPLQAAGGAVLLAGVVLAQRASAAPSKRGGSLPAPP